MSQVSPSAPVVVRNGVGEVAAVNLIAALRFDSPERDIYLMEDMPTVSLAARAKAAGVRGILNCMQVSHLLSMGQWGTDYSELDDALGVPVATQSVRRLPEVHLITAEPTVGLDSGREPAQDPAPALELPTEPAIGTSLTLASSRASSSGRIVGIFSGRGGVGKSAVALMAAICAQDRGLKVALVDMDMQFGDIGFLAGREPSSRIQRLALGDVVGNVLPQLSEDAMTLVLAPNRPEEGEQFTAAVPNMLNNLANSKDIVIVNTGAFWTDLHARIIDRCDYLALLMDQRASSIEACKQAVDLCLRLHAPQAKLVYLLNGCGRHAALTPQDASLALGGVPVIGLADGGALVDELLALGCPMELLGSGNVFVGSLMAFLDSFLGQVASMPLPETAQSSYKQKARVFDLSLIKGFFEGGRRVTT
jgi:pilus assembly protein CpaE